jgi:hypothetical protein
MVPGTQPDTLKSPAYSLGQGKYARLEFSHIPMLANATVGGKILVRICENGVWNVQPRDLIYGSTATTNPTCYDRAYGDNVGTASFSNTNRFFAACYYAVQNVTPDNSYWKNEVFMITPDLIGPSVDSIQIMFVIPTSTGSWSGWYLDDIRLYAATYASTPVKIPNLRNIVYPENYTHPNCSDNLIRVKVDPGLSAVGNVTLFYQIGSEAVQSVAMNLSTDPGVEASTYEAYIPFVGFGIDIRWRLEATNTRGDLTRFPYCFGQWNVFKNVRPFVNTSPLSTENLANNDYVFSKAGISTRGTQMRYSAAELTSKGYTPGIIKYISFNVTEKPQNSGIVTIGEFRVRMFSVDPTYVNISEYGGVPMTENNPIYVSTNSLVAGGSGTYQISNLGWNKIRLTTPFIWDGVSDIVIQVIYNNPSTFGGSVKIQTYSTSEASRYKTRMIDASTNQLFWDKFVTSPQQITFATSVSVKPNIILGFADCLFGIDAAMSNVLTNPNTALNNPKLYKVDAGTDNLFTAWVRNDGFLELPSGATKWNRKHTNATSWETANGTAFANFASGVSPIDTLISIDNDTTFHPSDSVSLAGNINFPNEGYYYIKFWTEILPPDIDYNQRNDTAHRINYPNFANIDTFEVVSCLSGGMTGTYSIGTSAGAVKSFKTFEEAFRMLKICGVAGPVTINVDAMTGDQYYTDILRFPVNVQGASATNTITFKGTSPSNPTKMMANSGGSASYNLDSCSHLRFENFLFQPAREYSQGAATVFNLSGETSDIKFKKCKFMKFTPASSFDSCYRADINSLINVSAANDITIDSCTFAFPVINAIDIKGMSSSQLSSGITISNSLFENGQVFSGTGDTLTTESAIFATYTSGLNIIKDTFKTAILPEVTSTIYTVRIENSKTFDVSKNTFRLENVSGIALKDIIDDDAAEIYKVSNNEISIYNNILSTIGSGVTVCGINFLSGHKTYIAHNNMWIRDNVIDQYPAIGVRIGEDQQTIDSIGFINNVIVSEGGSMDNGSRTGVAVWLKTEENAVLNFKNNIYYKLNPPVTDPPVDNSSDLLFKYGVFMPSLSSWGLYTGEINSFYTENPFFNSWNDLKTNNPLLVDFGTDLLSLIPDDKNGVLRDITPNAGAYEQDSLEKDIVLLDTYIKGKGVFTQGDTSTWTACDFANDSITIKYMNIGNTPFASGNVTLRYRVGTINPANGNVIYGTAIQKPINYAVMPGVMYEETLPPYNFANTVLNTTQRRVVQTYSTCATDYFKPNDTIIINVISKGQDAKPTDKTVTVPYGPTTLLTANEYPNDSIYWFLHESDQNYVLKSHQYQTGILYGDTAFYFSKKTEQPNVKISEIQITKTVGSQGITSPIPIYISNALGNQAFEISNLGNGPIDLTGYKFTCYINSSSNNDTLKTPKQRYVFPNNYILPANSSVVLVAVNANTVLPNGALALGSTSAWNVTATQKIGYILRKNDTDSTIIDAVAINGGIFMNTLNVPSSIWQHVDTININNSPAYAGISRINVTAPNGTGWRLSTNSNPMTIGTYDDILTTMYDNGCYGYKAKYTVIVSPLPERDPCMQDVSIVGQSDDSICNLGNEHIQVTLLNTGTLPITNPIPITCMLYSGTNFTTPIQTITDSYTGGIASGGASINYVLSNTLNLSAHTATTNYTIKAFVNYTGDIHNWNDTATTSIVSLVTPYAPSITSPVTIPYGTPATLSTSTATTLSYVAWYDDNMVLIDTGNTYITPNIYETTSFYVSAIKNGVNGCESDRIEVVVIPSPIPDCDVAIKNFSSPFDEHVQSNVSEPIDVVIKNYGNDPITSVDINWSLGGILKTPPPTWTGNLMQGQTDTIHLGDEIFAPGEEKELKAWINNMVCDTIPSNDTLIRNLVACYGNEGSTTNYTIGTSGEDFPSFTAAVAALATAGICGPVIFDVSAETYTENVTIPEIHGTSTKSYVLFRGASGLTPTLTAASGTVLTFNNASHIRFNNLNIVNSMPSNYAGVNVTNSVEINNSDSIKWSNVTFNAPAKTVAYHIKLEGQCNNLFFDTLEFTNGGSCIYNSLSNDYVNNITIRGSIFTNFKSNGLSIQNFNGAKIDHNNFFSLDTVNALNAILLRNGNGEITVSANKVTLRGKGGIKTGLNLKKLSGTNINPTYVYNNVVAIVGDTVNVTSLAYMGIDIDTIYNMNIFYNSIRVFASKNSTASKSLSIGSGESIKIQNNNLENASKGYVYYVKAPGSQVSYSNYNNYRGTSVTGSKFVSWGGTDAATLTDLRALNYQEGNSDSAYNPFRSNTDLTMYYPTSIVGKANVVSAIGTDINNTLRHYINPTIGAYEYSFPEKDWGVTSAYPDRGIVFPINDSVYVEHYAIGLRDSSYTITDEQTGETTTQTEQVEYTMYSQVRIGNFGDNGLNNIPVTIQFSNSPNFETDSICYEEAGTYNIPLASKDIRIYSSSVPMSLPLPDVHTPKNNSRVLAHPLYVRAFTSPMSIDTMPINDSTKRPVGLTTLYSDTTKIYIEPAYDVKVLDIVTTGHIGKKCDLRQDTVVVSIKNTGHFTLMPTNTSNWKMYYQVQGRPPIEESVQWANMDMQDIAPDVTATYTFATRVNLYPQNYDFVNICDSSSIYGTVMDTIYRDTTYNIRAWSRLPLDSVFENDTSKHTLTTTAGYTSYSGWTSITSLADPVAPHAHNDTIYLGTYGHPWADQIQKIPSNTRLIIRWFKDSTNRDSEFNIPQTGTNLVKYQKSQIDSTIKLFHDTTYFLMTQRTDANPACTSKFTPISVIIRDRVPKDLSMEQIIEPYYIDTTYTIPIPLSWVYMTAHDTIKVRLANYGTDTAWGNNDFKLWYSIKPTSPANAPEVLKGEAHFTGFVPPFTNHPTGVTDPNNYVDFAFPYTFPYNTEQDSLNDMSADFSDPSKTYQIKTWLTVANDVIPQNDTISDSIGRTNYFAKLKPRNGTSVYPSISVSDVKSLDISRVRLGVLDNYSVPIGNSYTNYTQTADTAILYKGILDSLYVTVSASTSMTRIEEHDTVDGYVKAYIDWNRDGEFTANERVMALPVKMIAGGDVTVQERIRPYPDLNPNIINGYTRMRVLVWEDKKVGDSASLTPYDSFTKGEVEDYLVQVRTIDSNNAALAWFTLPVEENTETHSDIYVKVRNVGINPLQQGTKIDWSKNGGITWESPYILTNDDLSHLAGVTTSQTDRWHNVKIADYITIDTGLTHFVAYITAPNDESHKNDTANLYTFLFKTPTLPYVTNFDSSAIDNSKSFWAKEPNYKYPSNCWEIGKIIRTTPPITNGKTVFDTAYSPENCLVTDLDQKHPANNVSIIYTPIFNIGVVKPDTLSFMIRRALNSNTSMRVEYKSKNSIWRILGAMNDGYGTNWYNNSAGFITTKTWENASYSLLHLVNEGRISPQDVQFRFVFRSASSTHDGFAIDDFRLGRAKLALDAGATSIKLTPEIPNYGDTIHPVVYVKNLGASPLTNFNIHYIAPELRYPSGDPMIIEQSKEINDTMGIIIAPGDSMQFSMPAVVIGSNTPPRFTIIARANHTNEPLPYRDNDTAKLLVTIAPMLNDMGVQELVYPRGTIAVDENVSVTAKFKNYGVVKQNNIPVAYQLSTIGSPIIRDTIHLNVDLAYGEECTFTFNQTFTAHYGQFNIKVWTELDADTYHSNDTMIHRIGCATSFKDLVADVVMIDDNDPTSFGIQLNFINRSTMPVDNIKVGYYVNDDISTVFSEPYNSGEVLGSSMGYHTFSARLPRQYYSSICGFVHVDGDTIATNDTTCNRYFGYTDVSADAIDVEERDAETCRLQVHITNRGTLGNLNIPVRFHIAVDGQEVHNASYTLDNFVPGQSMPVIMNYLLPRSQNSVYNLKAWIEFPNDINPNNDTTINYNVVRDLDSVGLYDITASGRFILEQNTPNPLNDATEIDFVLPRSGNIYFYIVNNEGKTVHTYRGAYSGGRHTLKLDNIKLPQGIYFYTMEFEENKLTRKMLITR